MATNRWLVLTAVSCLAVQAAGRRFKQPCAADADCWSFYGSAYECHPAEKTCRHKLNFPYRRDVGWHEWVGFASIVVCSGVANAGGIGGGGILAPIFIFIFGYTIQESIPLTKATILAGAIVNLFVILKKKHPIRPDEHIIDFGLVSIILPLLLAGTMIGVILTQTLPPVITLLILTAYLVKVTRDVGRK